MYINIVILNDTEIETAYEHYKNQVHKIFNDSKLKQNDNLEVSKNIEIIKKQAVEFYDLLKNKYNDNIMQFSEEFYEDNIFDIYTENLLSNGLYKKNEIINILVEKKIHMSDDFFIVLSNLAEKIDENEKILFWNL